MSDEKRKIANAILHGDALGRCERLLADTTMKEHAKRETDRAERNGKYASDMEIALYKAQDEIKQLQNRVMELEIKITLAASILNKEEDEVSA